MSVKWLAGVVVAGAVVGLAAAFMYVGRWLEAPAQPASQADVIVLLGGDSKARLVAGVELYRRRIATTVTLAGEANEAGPAALAPTNARLEYLLEQGIPREAIVVGEPARSSKEEANATLRLMRQMGWRKALVVSDPPHMRRLSWIWRRAFDGAGLSYVLVASHPAWWRGGEWWRDQWAGEFVRTEVIKIAYYFANP